jgi:hypothetical protein
MSNDTAMPQRVDVLGGLLRREWQATGRLITGFVVVWVLGVVVLELCYHPFALIAFGCVYARMVGFAAGGGEAFAGCEEFTFALPATRQQRYLARLLLAGSVLLALQLLGIAAIALDLPQLLWRPIVESGFTAPFPAVRPQMLYWLAAALPIACFATTFAVAANAANPAPARLVGLLLPGAAVGLGFLMEVGLWDRITGTISCPALFALAPLALLVGHRSYLRKEGVSRPEAASGGSSTRPWIASGVALVIVVIALLLLTAVTSRVSQAADPSPVRHIPTSPGTPP